MRQTRRGRAVAAAILLFLGVVAGSAAAAPSDTDEALNRTDAQLIKKWKAEKRRSTDAELYQDLGFSYFRQQNFDRAFLYFNAATMRNAGLYWSWYYLGLLNLESAEPYFKKAIAAKKDFAPAYYWLGRIYAGSDRREAALLNFERYLKWAADDTMETSRIREVEGYVSILKAGGTISAASASETQPLQRI